MGTSERQGPKRWYAVALYVAAALAIVWYVSYMRPRGDQVAAVRAITALSGIAYQAVPAEYAGPVTQQEVAVEEYLYSDGPGRDRALAGPIERAWLALRVAGSVQEASRLESAPVVAGIPYASDAAAFWPEAVQSVRPSAEGPRLADAEGAIRSLATIAQREVDTAVAIAIERNRALGLDLRWTEPVAR